MDIILTGIPRSGTTLTCSLLNQLPQCIALHEPMHPSELTGVGFPDEYLEKVVAFFAGQRASLLTSGAAVSKARDGRVPDDPISSVHNPGSLRPLACEHQEVQFNKKLRMDFRLVIKHPNFFTATLDVLKTRFPCFAIVRNPLAVLLSWISVNRGRIPFGEAFGKALKAALDSEPDCLERQITILRWSFARYAAHLGLERVIRYETLIADGGRALSVIDPDAATLSLPLTNRNTSALYEAGLVRRFAARLLDEPSIYGGFYGKREIEDLLRQWIN